MEQTKILDITKFSPPVAELQALVEQTKKVTLEHLDNKLQLEIVKEYRIKLKNARVNITKYGKILREDALRFQKDVITKEKELISIIEPEENRLGDLENKANEYVEKQKRIALIPQRRQILSEIDRIEISDEELIAMEDLEFQEFCNKVVAQKNERERLIVEEEKKKIEEEKTKLVREKELKEVQERAIQEERKRAEEIKLKEQEEKNHREKELKESKERIVQEAREAKERIEKEEREAKERITKQEKEAKEKIEREERERKEKAEAETKAKEEAERKKIEEQEKLKKEIKFQDWKKKHGYTGEGSNDLYLMQIGGKWRIYRLISSYEDK